MSPDDVEALRAEIFRLEAEGHYQAEIARLAGCSRITVYRALKARAGPDARRAAGRGALTDPAVMAAIGEHARAGLSTGQIAARIERDFGAAAASQATVGRLAAAYRRAPGDTYRGPSAADIKAAAAADPAALRTEIEILRSHVYALNRLISRTTGNDRTRFGLLREIRELIDCMSRACRASHADHASHRDSNLDEVGKAAEHTHSQGQRDGTHDAPPARQADAAGA